MADIPRIKRNIQRMIDQSAPEADIDAYVSSEGVTLEDLQAPTQEAPQPAQQATDSQPWYKEAGQAADDIVRLAANGLTFGYADKLAGYMNGTGAEAERKLSQAAGDRAGLAGDIAEIAGGVAGGNALLRGGGALLTGVKALPKVGGAVGALTNGAASLAARPGLTGLATRTAGAAATGAGLGALDATGRDQDVTEGAVLGGVFGAGGNLVSEGASKVLDKAAGLFNKKPVVASVEELRQLADDAYKAADNAGVIIKPQGIRQLASDIKQSLANDGYHPSLQPKIAAALDELDRLSQGNVTLKGVDVLRKIANGAKTDADASTRKFGGDFVEKIDDFLDNLNPNVVLTGNKTEGVKALQTARKLWSVVKKSELIDEAVQRATNNASASGSGGNVDNAIRQQFKAILNDKKKRRGFTKDEITAIQLVVKGTPTQNAMRLLGKLSPQGGGLALYGQIMGGIASGGTTLPLAAAGGAAKLVADKMTPRNVEQLSRIVRSGGDASALSVPPNALQRLAQAKRNALTMPLTITGIMGPSPAYPEDN